MAEWDVVSQAPAPSFDDRWQPVSQETVSAQPWQPVHEAPVQAQTDIGAALPEGHMNPEIGPGAFIHDLVKSIFSLPQRAIEGSQQDVANMGSGEPMASVGPAAETAMMIAPLKRTVGGVRAHPTDAVEAPRVEPVAGIPTTEWKPVSQEPAPPLIKVEKSGRDKYNILDTEGNILAEADIGIVTIDGKRLAQIDDINTPALNDVKTQAEHDAVVKASRNVLGTNQMREAMRQFLELHPDVAGFTGNRVSGARNQGVMDARNVQNVTVDRPAVKPSAAAETGATPSPPDQVAPVEAVAHPEPTSEAMPSAKSAARTIQNILVPDEVSPMAQSAAADIRAAGGKAARDTETTRAALDAQSRVVSALPDSEKLGLIDYIENRSKPNAPELPKQLQPVADAVKTAMDSRRAKIEGLSSIEKAHFVEDYYTHLWKDPEAARVAFSGPAKEGTGRFLKERTVPTVAEGIERGLQPVSIDPLETTMRYVQSMDRFIATEEVINKGIADGNLRHFTPGEQPAGWVRVNTRRGASNPLYAPEDWARVYNNFVDRGIHAWSADIGKIYDGARNTSNAITSLELGLSGFHAATMAQESVVNAVARGIGELASGKPISAVKTLAKAPVAPVADLLRGRSLEATYLNKAKGTPLMQEIADLLTEAGGRGKGAKHAPDYQYSQAGSYWDSFKRGSVLAEIKQAGADIRARPIAAPLKLLAQQVGRVMSTVAKPLFEYAIPKMKNGAFYENMASWMEANPAATHVDQVKAARKIWNSIDNRFGEVVQDNIFWNKTMKQSLQVGLRSYSWTFGTIQEIAGGAKDLLRHPSSLSPKSQHYSPKAAYVLALPIVHATLNAVYQKLKTGDNPESIKDVMRGGMTGGLVPGAGGRGEVPERAMMPGYMKDVFGWYDHPWQELKNKVATGPRMVTESLANKDWKDQPIRNPSAPYSDQVRQYLQYVYQSLGPISVKQMLKGQKEGSNLSAPETLLGLHAAPTFLQDPEGYDKMLGGIHGRDWQKKERYDKKQERQYQGP